MNKRLPQRSEPFGGKSYRNDLGGANPDSAQFVSAVLRDANLTSGTYTWNSKFDGADLTRANLTDVYIPTLVGANITDAVVKGAGQSLRKYSYKGAALLDGELSASLTSDQFCLPAI